MTQTLTRAGFIGAAAAAFTLASAPLAFAARNSEAETYVQTNATTALASLDTHASTADSRQREFGRLMSQFADVPRIANFVLGRYALQLRANPQLMQQWQATFQDYAIAVYEDQLDQFRGNAITVTGSVERIAGQDVIVRTQITPHGAARPMNVQWRILKTGAAWKVVDVSLVLDGNEIWLAQQQQRDLLAQLDRTNGDIPGLIQSVRTQTAQMRARIRARARS